MVKAELLRTVLQNTIPLLADNPDKLELYIDEGNVIGTGSHSASFEYQYTLNIIINDFAQSIDMVMVPIMEFIRQNQPELVDNPERRKDGFRFIADLNNHDSTDISIYLKLTERVIVKEENGVNKITHANEPKLNEYPNITDWELYIDNDLVQHWQTNNKDRL